MDNETETSPEYQLTKTEAFVIECRERGMSDTAIRRLLQLSAAEAVALGVVPAQAVETPSPRDASVHDLAPASWPQREGRRRAFPRRGRSQAQTLRRSPRGQGRSRRREEPSPQRQPIRKEFKKSRGDNV